MSLPLIGAAAGLVILAVIVFAVWTILKRRRHPGTEQIRIAAEHYDIPLLVRAVEKLNSTPQIVLLAATGISDLPVTVPVNLAIQLAKKGKCLLIDLDLNRNAVAKVFEAENADVGSGFHLASLPTSIDNLFIWPARHFEALRQMNLGNLLREAQKKYDYILLYAPYLTSLADRRQIAASVKQALIFGSQKENGGKLIKLLNSCKCRILQTA